MDIQRNCLKRLFSSCVLRVSGLILFAALLFPHAVLANKISQFDRSVFGFVNHNSSQSLLFISSDGKADWMNDTSITKKVSYAIANPSCTPRGQNTMTMDKNQGGMTLAYPFLVGVGWVCKIDDQTNSIHLISQFTVPENAYSVVYAGEDESTSYFLLNSKPWKSDGYLHLISIHKLTSQVTTRVFATNVPGYSGAMLFDKNGVWVTTWPGKIYKIPHETIISLAKEMSRENFSQISQLMFSGINGMSLFMLPTKFSFVLQCLG